ncbi:efflux transporter outer membrane subunit [Undibacterium sp.]|uniref:efflux transporter outer membrane subunit n=1 Tax=Undibacterium sp. TaxID=1914977 RepID=UPI00374DBA12
MINQIQSNQIPSGRRQFRSSRLLLSLAIAAMLPGCASFADLGSNQHIAIPKSTQDTTSLPAEHGHWPAADWAAQFGDPQLSALIAEALKQSPTLAQASARVAAAAAFTETARANTQAKVSGDYTLSRQQYSSSALVPPPYAGSWQTENKAVVSASYELDVWGKNSSALQSSISKLRASEAEQEKVKLTLSAAIARSYNELARLYALRDLAGTELEQRQQLRLLTDKRAASGLDTEVEQQGTRKNLASSQASLTALDGQILDVRYQLAALLGAAPDRGLQIARPSMGAGDTVALPDNLPADLVSRRPDIVVARWNVDASTRDIKVAKADFYPDINLTAAIGLDAFGFGRFLNAASRTVSAAPAVHLPIFDGGALRAQLKGRYADFDYAVANYNQTLVSALSEVAVQLAKVRSTDAQLADAQAASNAATRTYQLTGIQYKAGLTTQLNVVQARINALASEQNVTGLRMNRRDQQIALAAALGGGFVDASGSVSNNATASQAASRPAAPASSDQPGQFAAK